MKHKTALLLTLILLLPSLLSLLVKVVGEAVSTLTMIVVEPADQEVSDESLLIVSDQTLEATPNTSNY